MRELRFVEEKAMENNVNINWQLVRETIRNTINKKYEKYKPMINDIKLTPLERRKIIGRCEGLAEALFIVLSAFDIAEQVLNDKQDEERATKESNNVDIESNNLHVDSNS